MKSHILSFLLFFLSVPAILAQTPALNCKAIAGKKISISSIYDKSLAKVEEGEELKFISWRATTDQQDPIYGTSMTPEFVIEYNDGLFSMDMKEVKNLTFSSPSNRAEFWNTFALSNGILENLANNGIRYDLRGELDEEAINFIDLLENNNLVYHDEFLEDYIQGLIFRIHPGGFDDKRPGNLNLILYNESIPNAYSLPNGSIILTTGLLSVIDSEEELMGVLAHEIAHFIGDHHVNNILAVQKRAQRAEFWAGMATVAAGVAEAYVASNNDYYVPGNLTYSMAVLSSQVAQSVLERFGINYSQDQEFQADEAAFNVMQFLDLQPEAYVTALAKIGNYYYRTGLYEALTGSHTHPSMRSRLSKLSANPKDFYNVGYQKNISFVNTHNARIEYQRKHFAECEKLVDRNIDAGVATEDDYILKALATRVLYGDSESINRSLNYLKKAEALGIEPNAYISKQKGITYLKLNQKDNALQSFNDYLTHLTSLYDEGKDEMPMFEKDNIEKEISWTKRMIFKI
jgi:beta-barrel assembly-enhancing protease